jgi:Stage II sporulation protein E (SpoIIE)/PTS HPr component phosphorylation site
VAAGQFAGVVRVRLGHAADAGSVLGVTGPGATGGQHLTVKASGPRRTGSGRRAHITLKPGDRLLFYTDGLVEARDRAGRFLELGSKVAEALAEPDLDAAFRRLVRLLRQHAGRKLADDVLLVLGEPVEP